MKRKSTTSFESIAQRERALRAKQRTWRDGRASPEDMSRREFIMRTAATGLALGTPPLLLACKGDVDRPAPQPGTEQRTLFFNLAHEGSAASKGYFLVGGGRRYALTRTVDAPHVLLQARANNAFLRGVADDQITHHVEGAFFADDSVTLCHVGMTIDQEAGTWSMSSIYLHIPDSGAAHAYAKARQRTPSGPLPRSVKRERYGHAPAMTLQDVREENALVDTTSHASTLIMMHPDLLSGEPDSAHNIYTNHTGIGSFTKRLAETLTSLGPAMPQQVPNQQNAMGWATLQPLTNAGPSGIAGPVKNQNGTNRGQIQYFPDWHSEVDLRTSSAFTEHINNVKDDASLGTIVARGATPGATDLAGLIWFRHEGFTSVDPGSTATRAVRDDNVAMTLVDQSPENGLDITASFATSSGGVAATVTLANWYLRYLGVYVQFLDDANPPNVIALKNLSSYPDGIIPDHDSAGDTPNDMFAGIVPPEFTILAIPVDAGYATLTINVPKEASRVRLLASGLANNDSNNYPETIVLGIVLTAAINYALNIFFIAAGASTKLSVFQRTVIVPIAALFARELATLIGAGLRGTTDPAAWKSVGTTLLKAVLNTVASTLLRGVVIAIVTIVTESTLEDSIPVAGQILRAIACAVGFADIVHTTADVDMSPWTYVKDLAFTHDLSVTLAPDANHNVFPVAASQYKVTALFEDGTPRVQTFEIASPGPATLPPVVFPGVPLGGKVNVSVAFAQPATSPGADDILLGKGTTGLVPNTATDPIPTLEITEIKFPIGSTTVYQHQQKTTLAAGPTPGQPVHVWTTTKTAPTQQGIDNGNQPGDLSKLNSITVRQGTSRPPRNGYLGYAWRSYSSGVADCTSGATNQLDQLANLNADGGQAQNGYVNNRCGLQAGVKLAYSLLSSAGTNFYLDTSTSLIRQVQLEPAPQFADPKGNMAWGKLNFASDSLLLHPSGRLVSVSATDHQMETLKVAPAPMSDDQAALHLVARRHLGQGSQPGRLQSPAAAAISPDGVVLVLEQGNNRIQALDVGANPVRYFRRQDTPYFLNLTATAGGNTVYLDLAIEYTGFLYVLSVDQGQTSSVYRLDIYHPQQAGTTPISTTMNVNAGRLTVDFWRNVYTLNYEVMQFNGTYPAVTEPSVSLWTPCNVGQTC